jgi:hypothetical protein
MRYDVPFVPDTAYVALLRSHRDRLASVYFRLGPDVPDGRLPGLDDVTPQEILEGLSGLSGVPRYGLLNGRFHDASILSGGGLTDLVYLLEGFLAAGVLDGIVYADHYLLRALSDAAPEVASRLSAIPSVNCRLDSAERTLTLLDYIETTRFRPPDKLVLDRSLNRDTRRLAEVAAAIRTARPDLSLGLLVNEGCLFACPFKSAHEGQVAMARLRPARVGGDLKERLGCLRYFFEEPARMFASPFVRPEDVGRLEGLVDFCKLCGRTRGPRVLGEVVGAYFSGGYAGNLLWLLDTLEALADRLWVDNPALPDDFFARTDGCSRRCRDCGVCGGLADALVRDRGIGLTRLPPV